MLLCLVWSCLLDCRHYHKNILLFIFKRWLNIVTQGIICAIDWDIQRDILVSSSSNNGLNKSQHLSRLHAQLSLWSTDKPKFLISWGSEIHGQTYWHVYHYATNLIYFMLQPENGSKNKMLLQNYNFNYENTMHIGINIAYQAKRMRQITYILFTRHRNRSIVNNNTGWNRRIVNNSSYCVDKVAIYNNSNCITR